MTFQSPYETALQVDPAKEKAVLVNLKSNPAKLAELGLSPTEDFSQLKADPMKYNKVMAYVKGEAYKSPAYGALGTGQTGSEFVASQLGKYSATPSEYKATRAPELKSEYGVEPAQQTYQTISEEAYTAPYNIRETVAKKGGYDIDGLKTGQDEAVTTYLDARAKYSKGEIPRDEYIKAVSALSVSARSLNKGEADLETETNKAIGYFKQMQEQAKNKYDNARNAYETALEAEAAGYGESRKEKMAALDDMYKSSKEMLDNYKKEQDEYQKAKGNIYNPNTQKYESKPRSGPGVNPTKLAIEKMRQGLAQLTGNDGNLSPDDYRDARGEWARNGLDPAIFDKEFKGIQDPNNPWYVNLKRKSPETQTSNDSNPFD